MSDIFISYAADDRDRVLPLVQALEKTGWTIFWDRTIPAGKTWRQRMDAEIQACRSVLVVWTEKSVHSEWVLEEAEIGKRQQILVPVLLDKIEPPFGFGLIQAANLVDWNGSNAGSNFGRLVSDIEIILGPVPANRVEGESCPPPERGQEAERSREQPFSRSDEETGRSAESKQQNVAKDPKNDREGVPTQFPWPGRSRSSFLRVLITSATKSSAWFSRIAGTLIGTLIISVIILVVSEISLGWHLAPAEVSVIVMFVWLIVVAVTTLRSRWKRKPTHAID